MKLFKVVDIEKSEATLQDLFNRGLIEEVKEPPKRRVRLRLDYDLRTDQVIKSMDCAKGEDWTAFVNKKRTLVHAMLYDRSALLVRLPGLKMKDWSERSMKEALERLLTF